MKAIKDDLLDYLIEMQTDIDKAIIATSQGDNLVCLEHISNIEKSITQIKEFAREHHKEILDGK